MRKSGNNRGEPSWLHLQSAAPANLLYNHKIKVLEEPWQSHIWLLLFKAL